MTVKNKVKIAIDGKTFTLMGFESEAHMKKVADYINERIKDVRKSSMSISLDSSLAYILTSINVADAYLKEQEKTEELRMRVHELETQKDTNGFQQKISALEAKLEKSEDARKNAENKLDNYVLAMEGNANYALNRGNNRVKNHKK